MGRVDLEGIDSGHNNPGLAVTALAKRSTSKAIG